MKKISKFLSENFQCLVVKFSIYLNRRVFVRRVYSKRKHFSYSGPFLEYRVALLLLEKTSFQKERLAQESKPEVTKNHFCLPCSKWQKIYCESNYLIAKTYLYNFDLLKPHFYIVKLGFTGVYIIFLISAQKHRLWYSLEPPHRCGSNEYPQSMF